MYCKEGYIVCTIKINFFIDFAPHYVFVLKNKLYNQRTARWIKQSMKGGSIGYYIDGDFWSYSSLKQHIKKPGN